MANTNGAQKPIPTLPRRARGVPGPLAMGNKGERLILPAMGIPPMPNPGWFMAPLISLRPLKGWSCLITGMRPVPAIPLR